jgi:hypothetical protein
VVMAKRKRTAEELARLISKTAPLPRSEWVKVYAEFCSISKSNRRRQFVIWLIVSFFMTATWLGFLTWIRGLVFPFILFCISWLISFSMLMGLKACEARMFVRGCVQGLRFHEPGAPKKWTTAACEEAVAAVQAMVAETELSVARSIEILKKREPVRWQNLSEPRYYEAVRRLRNPRDTTSTFS